jgi:hypothetical protein
VAAEHPSAQYACVVFMDPHNGDPGLVPVVSGTGDAVTEEFDPAWVVDLLKQLDHQ